MTKSGAQQTPGDHKVRVLLSKIGLDGHDRGAKVVFTMLRDAGMEVVYLGIHNTEQSIVKAAMEEDVDVIGLSSLGGTHLNHCRKVIELLAENDLGHLPVVVGGTIPVEDIPALENHGVCSVLRPGSTREEIVNTITELGRTYRGAI